jgi:hypothetical protein
MRVLLISFFTRVYASPLGKVHPGEGEIADKQTGKAGMKAPPGRGAGRGKPENGSIG